MNISVVIPAHNEAAALPACLSALAGQKTRHDIEIIVVDNASTDQTKAIAESWQNRLKLRVIHEPVKGRGRARRSGFAAAKTEIVLSTDADSIVPSGWAEKLVSSLVENPEAVAASGSSYINDGTKLTNWTMRVGMPLSLRIYRLLIGHYMLTGANFIIRRQAYEAAGGFDAEQDMLDDVDLAFRVSQIGRILYLKEPRVLTEGDIFKHGYLKGFWHYARHLPPLLGRYWFKRKTPHRSE
jgi:glycosyltransferase involved in cell wall biosynthesis